MNTEFIVLIEKRWRSSLIRVYTVCHSVCIVWTHYSMVGHIVQILRVITTNFRVSEYLGNLWYIALLYYKLTLWAFGSTELKKENVVPNTFLSALDKMGMDITKKKQQKRNQKNKTKQSANLFIYFLPIMVNACNQNLQLQANVTGPLSTCAGFTSRIYHLFAFNIKISWFGGPLKRKSIGPAKKSLVTDQRISI